jgi:Zn-dependent protease
MPSADFFDRLLVFLMFLPILAVHEWAHAWSAHKLGDDTAKDLGRVTLNPLAHIDPIGTLLIPAINIFFNPAIAIIGWGKPVPVNLSNLGSWRRDHTLIALAGPLSNFLLSAFTLGLGALLLPPEHELRKLVLQFAYVSIFLGVFNLLPVFPLDGFTPLRHLFRIPEETIQAFGWGWLVLLLVLINLKPVMDFLSDVSSLIFFVLVRPMGY